MVARKTDLRPLYDIFKFAKPYKKGLVILLGLLVFGSWFTTVSPYILKIIIDEAIPGKRLTLLYILVVLIGLAYVIETGLDALRSYYQIRVGQRIMIDIKIKLLEHLTRLSPSFYTEARTGDIMSRLESDVSVVEQLTTRNLLNFITNTVMTVYFIGFLAYLQKELLLLAIAIIPFLYFCQRYFGAALRKGVMPLRQKIGQISSLLQETISSIRHIQIMHGAGKRVVRYYVRYNKELLRQHIKVNLLSILANGMAGFATMLGLIIIYGYGGYKVIVGSMSIGGLVAFNMYLQRLYSSFNSLVDTKLEVQRALASIERIFEIFDVPVSIPDKANAISFNHTLDGLIEFRNVSFAYTDSQQVLRNVSFTVRPKSITAIVGESGAGKSTIVNLLLRLWDVNEGQIVIDNIDARDYKLSYLRKNIAVVTQDIFLFNASILENITLANPRSSMQEVETATKSAEIYDFIRSLPEQFNTFVGERGVKLSGGQKQRIAISQALLKDSPILIFDEATSSLDTISEGKIQEGLEDYMRNRTTIIIAHRLSTIKSADNIVVFNKGKLVEEGSHDELMAKQGYYYELYKNGVDESRTLLNDKRVEIVDLPHI